MITHNYGDESPHVELNLSDEAVLAFTQNTAGAGDALKEADPVKWLAGTIAIAKEINVSEVTDMDMMAAAMTQERSMDRVVHNEVRKYLGTKGMRWMSGCFG